MKRCWVRPTHRRSCAATVPFLRPWHGPWSLAPSPTRDRGPPCAGSTLILRPGRWCRWNHGRGCFPAVWPPSSSCAISVAAPPTVTRRSDTATMPTPGPTAARPARTTGLGPANAATTPNKPPGWRVSTSVDENHTHTAEFITPTGSRHRSGAPPHLPAVTVSELEVRIGIALARYAA